MFSYSVVIRFIYFKERPVNSAMCVEKRKSVFNKTWLLCKKSSGIFIALAAATVTVAANANVATVVNYHH